MSTSIIAIDGPAASGKSSVSRRVAGRLGRLHVDSGAVYRALTWQLIREGRGGRLPDDWPAWLARVRLAFRQADGTLAVHVNGAEPGSALRSAAVQAQVSAVAAVPAVREWVVDRLRGLVRFGALVMEGRDIGTVVFPQAAHKFYLDADPLERARRRRLDSQDAEGQADLATVAAQLRRRDTRDAEREVAPLAAAPDAVRIDTTRLTLDEVVETVLRGVGATAPAPSGEARP